MYENICDILGVETRICVVVGIFLKFNFDKYLSSKMFTDRKVHYDITLNVFICSTTNKYQKCKLYVLLVNGRHNQLVIR